MEPIFFVRREFLKGALDFMRASHGSPLAYLQARMALTTERIDRLRGLLLEPVAGG
jgi:hypothetical protein